VLGRFAELGAVSTQNAQALARESDLIMTCLPTSAEVRDVLFGEGRVAEVLQPSQILADMTTGDPGETRDIRELFQTVINEHGADKDTQTLVRLFERNAGVAIAPQK
jgi:3-hydroxyisobutyrate dehydrogenase-like beta-hydroxyacid dehydrogenase